jgi:hypothetical protein
LLRVTILHVVPLLLLLLGYLSGHCNLQNIFLNLILKNNYYLTVFFILEIGDFMVLI